MIWLIVLLKVVACVTFGLAFGTLVYLAQVNATRKRVSRVAAAEPVRLTDTAKITILESQVLPGGRQYVPVADIIAQAERKAIAEACPIGMIDWAAARIADLTPHPIQLPVAGGVAVLGVTREPQTMIDRLRDERWRVHAQAKAMVDLIEPGRSSFTPVQQSTWDMLLTRLEVLDRRIAEASRYEQAIQQNTNMIMQSFGSAPVQVSGGGGSGGTTTSYCYICGAKGPHTHNG